MDARAFQEHAQALLDSGSLADAVVRLRDVGGSAGGGPARTLRVHQFVLGQSGFFAGLLRGAADAGRWAAPRRRARAKSAPAAVDDDHAFAGGAAAAPVVFDIATSPAVTADAVEACIR